MGTAVLLKGAPVAASITESLIPRVRKLEEAGITPTLAVVRAGEKDGDLSYERGAAKRCAQAGIAMKSVVLPADIDNTSFLETVEQLNRDPEIHGILLFQPFPKQIDRQEVLRILEPGKDVDGCTSGSYAGIFSNTPVGFAPCTAQAVMEILHHYRIDIRGKHAVIIGRSMVIGRPAALLLLHENATVTICHTGTVDLPSFTRNADIIVAASGQMESIGHQYFREGQVVIDVGIHWNEEKQKLCGDVLFEEAEKTVSCITPVPGGVGSVTTAVLCKHTVEAAEREVLSRRE